MLEVKFIIFIGSDVAFVEGLHLLAQVELATETHSKNFIVLASKAHPSRGQLSIPLFLEVDGSSGDGIFLFFPLQGILEFPAIPEFNRMWCFATQLIFAIDFGV